MFNVFVFISMIILCFASYALGYNNGVDDTREKIEKMLNEVIDDVQRILESKKNGQ